MTTATVFHILRREFSLWLLDAKLITMHLQKKRNEIDILSLIASSAHILFGRL